MEIRGGGKSVGPVTVYGPVDGLAGGGSESVGLFARDAGEFELFCANSSVGGWHTAGATPKTTNTASGISRFKGMPTL